MAPGAAPLSAPVTALALAPPPLHLRLGLPS